MAESVERSIGELKQWQIDHAEVHRLEQNALKLALETRRFQSSEEKGSIDRYWTHWLAALMFIIALLAFLSGHLKWQ